MVTVIQRRDIYIETVSKRDGSLYLKRITRRAVCVGLDLWEFRYNNQRMYAHMAAGQLVCDARTLWMSTPYQRMADIAA